MNRGDIMRRPDRTEKSRSRHIPGTILRVSALILILAVVYLALGFYLPSLPHRQVSDEFADSFNAEDYISDTTGSERVLCIDDNSDAMAWRLRMIDEAKDEIILSLFELRDDDCGLAVMSALYEAAERGVQVRILLDGMYAVMRVTGNYEFRALSENENVSIKLYNPVSLIKSWTLCFRMHDKYLIIDDDVYILGGRNTHDLFLNDDIEGYDIDRELLIYESGKDDDSSIHQLKNYFEEIWSSPYCKDYSCTEADEKITEAENEMSERYTLIKETYPQIFEAVDYEKETIPANKVTLLSNPYEAGNKEPELWYALCELMKNGEDVIIQTPYIVCSKAMYDDLEEVCLSTENLEILINSPETGANPPGCTDYMNHKDNILKTGATIYEYIGDHSVHTKTVLIDDNISIVGSYNLDMRSTYLNTELMLVVDCKELNASLRSEAEEECSCSRQVLPDGTEILGDNCIPVEMPEGKKIMYTILRILNRPFRSLM